MSGHRIVRKGNRSVRPVRLPDDRPSAPRNPVSYGQPISAGKAHLPQQAGREPGQRERAVMSRVVV